MAKVGQVPAEQRANINESVPLDQRSPDFDGPKTEGPLYDADRKSYGRAEYTTKSGNTRRDR